MTTAAFHFSPYRLLPQQRQLLCGEQPIKLGGRAFDVLVALVEHRDRAVGKHELIDLVWPHLVVEENNLQVQMVALRKLFGHAAIVTVPGRGYRFTLPVVVEGPPSTQMQARETPDDARLIRPGNLPTRLPELIGRDNDVRAVLGLLEKHALVTIAGTGGIGKTRLAQAVAAAQLEVRPDGAWWVDLAPLADPSGVADAVARAMALGVDGGADIVQALWAALTAQAPLLVLDNAEHLLDGVADFVTRVRRHAPSTRVLITTQEVLRVIDEQVFRPDPLVLPDSDAPAAIEASAAVALFVARARAASTRFALDADNRVAVADICRRLDGIPLAIELAAARVGLLGVEGIREKLDQRFHVLTVGHRASLRRHQTLRAALEWSHQLLSAPEQVVLRRLAVFAGGYTLDAAQHVAEDDVGIDRWDVLEHLGALVDKSLVVAEGEAMPRYRLLETTRLFALDRLIDSGEAQAVRGRHRDHFLQLAEASQRHLMAGDASRRHIAKLDAERDNLLVALAWAPEAEDAIPGMRLTAALRDYWHLRAMPELGVQVTRAALERPGAHVRSLERCLALVTAGWMCTLAGRDEESLRYMDEALDLARDLGDATTLCLVLTKFAHVRHHRKETGEAQRLASEAVAVGRSLADCVEFVDALNLRAHVHSRCGERELARSMFIETLALRKRMKSTAGMISAHMNLAYLAIDAGFPDEAKPHLDAVLALMPQNDSQSAGLSFIAVTAQWAAIAGRHEDSVLLEAACSAQLDRAGMRNELEPVEVERLQRARLAMDTAARERLEMEGRAMSYELALERVRICLLGKQPLG